MHLAGAGLQRPFQLRIFPDLHLQLEQRGERQEWSLALGTQHLGAPQGDTRLVGAGARGKAAAHTPGKAGHPRSTPGTYLSYGYVGNIHSREFWNHAGVVQSLYAAQAEPALPCPWGDSSVTEELSGKRCLGLPVLHPSRAVHCLLPAKSVPEVLEGIQHRGTSSLPQAQEVLTLEWGQQGKDTQSSPSSTARALHSTTQPLLMRTAN